MLELLKDIQTRQRTVFAAQVVGSIAIATLLIYLGRKMLTKWPTWARVAGGAVLAYGLLMLSEIGVQVLRQRAFAQGAKDALTETVDALRRLTGTDAADNSSEDAPASAGRKAGVDLDAARK